MGKYFFLFLALILIGGLGYYYYASNISDAKFSITSPLPDLLTKAFPKAQGSEYAWKPREQVLGSAIKKPIINASAVAIYDLTTDKYLWRENVDKRLPIASLTKIMTAIVALENMELTMEIKVSKKAAEIGEGTMGLSEGEKFSLEELLYGLLLQSGNDAGEAIAAASPFGRDNFVYLMNKKGEELGLTNTHYTNPTGLQGDGTQFGTAQDLIVLTKYAMQNPNFVEIVGTYQHDISQTENHKALTLFNETNLLTSYSGVKGVKTGYTDEAGMCLVTYIDYEGHQMIGVLLNSANRRQEMKDLLDYSLKSMGVNPPAHP